MDTTHNQIVTGADGRLRTWNASQGRYDRVFEAGERHLALAHVAALDARMRRTPPSAQAPSYRVSESESADTYHPKRFSDGWRVWSPRLGQYIGPRPSRDAALRLAHDLKAEDDLGRALDADAQMGLFGETVPKGSQMGLFDRRNGQVRRRSKMRLQVF